MKKIFCYIFSLFFMSVFSQNNDIYPKQFFINPLKIVTEPSGTFGELRSNHFHSGFDFKTQQKQGIPIYAVADGFISRIKYSSFGYGKAIYITHSNGYTTVYGHLQKSNPEIEAYVNKQQYNKKSFEIELFPKKNELIVKQGDLLAYSGNSGGSGGPHLHFEYRDTKTEEIINPLLFGLDTSYKDTVAPTIKSLWAYPVSDSSVVNKSSNKVDLVFNKIANNKFIANKVYANGTIGLGINCYDMYNNHYNHNGVFKIEMFVNGSLHYAVTFDKFSFAETRYINSYIDYEHKSINNSTIQKLFYKNKYPLSLIQQNKTDGTIHVNQNESYSVVLKIYDFHNNSTEVTIPIMYDKSEALNKKDELQTDYYLKADRQNIYQKENVTVTIPQNTFIDDFYLDFDVKDNVLKLHKDIVPAYQNIAIEFDLTNNLPANFDAKKAFIADVSGKKPNYLNTYYKGNKLTARTKKLGSYKVLMDTISPKIYGLSFTEGANLNSVSTIKVAISDDQSGIKSYAGYINEKWILMEYDYKTKTLTHNLNDNIYVDGVNILKIEVIDNAGNKTTTQTKFTKSKTN